MDEQLAKHKLRATDARPHAEGGEEPRFTNRMCVQFLAGCCFDDRCTYAHSLGEMRELPWTSSARKDRGGGSDFDASIMRRSDGSSSGRDRLASTGSHECLPGSDPQSCLAEFVDGTSKTSHLKQAQFAKASFTNLRMGSKVCLTTDSTDDCDTFRQFLKNHIMSQSVHVAPSDGIDDLLVEHVGSDCRESSPTPFTR